MARKRASMREGPLAELFKATEAAQRQSEEPGSAATGAESRVPEETVEHTPDFAEQPARHLEPVESAVDAPAPARKPSEAPAVSGCSRRSGRSLPSRRSCTPCRARTRAPTSP